MLSAAVGRKNDGRNAELRQSAVRIREEAALDGHARRAIYSAASATAYDSKFAAPAQLHHPPYVVRPKAGLGPRDTRVHLPTWAFIAARESGP